jgi:uncharacterized protein (TIGR02466 family)
VTKVYNLFAIPISTTQLDYPVDIIETLCQQERRKNSKGVIKSNLGGWQSDNIIYPDSPFFFLQDIEKICQEVAKDVLKINKSVFLNNAWININQKDNLNQVHTHPNNILSGVYYVKTPEKCGNIIFRHPSFDMMERDWEDIVSDSDHNVYNSDTWWLPAKANTLYIFPSWIKHLVGPNMSDEERISMSFNFA